VLGTRARIEELHTSIQDLKTAGQEKERAFQREISKLMEELTDVEGPKAADCKVDHKRVTEESHNQASLAAADEQTAQLYDQTVKLREKNDRLQRDLGKARKSILDALQQVVDLQAELLELREDIQVMSSELLPEKVMMDIAKAKMTAMENQNKKLVAKNKELRKIAASAPKDVLSASELSADFNGAREENVDPRSEVRKLQCRRDSDKIQLSTIGQNLPELSARMNHSKCGVLPQRQFPQDYRRTKSPLNYDSACASELFSCRNLSSCTGGLSSKIESPLESENELLNMVSVVKTFDNVPVSSYLCREIETFWMLYSKIRRTKRFTVYDRRYGTLEGPERNRLMLGIRKTFEIIWSTG
jgi:hypothetical protein